eukprot:jgi/Bigna1/57898/fgenesh1_pm.35_\
MRSVASISSHNSSHSIAQRPKKSKMQQPLAERMRPRKLADVIGQEEVVAEDSILRPLISSFSSSFQSNVRHHLPSLILFGPPGVGKTTLARLIADEASHRFVEISAASCSSKDVKQEIERARGIRKLSRQQTVLFVDEIHRFNKLQQDTFLPHLESGLIVLIGATTQNPSFELTRALLSRVRVVELKPLTSEAIVSILQRALKDRQNGLGSCPILSFIARSSGGDARSALNILELAVSIAQSRGRRANARSSSTNDEEGQSRDTPTKHQNNNTLPCLLISARGSDIDASLYYLGRMLMGGDKPLYIARRLIRFASEDVGMGDPSALVQAVSAYQACHFVGMPECELSLAQAVVYLAKAPKSISVYAAMKRVKEAIRSQPNVPVPLHLVNAPTPLMKELGYSKGYQYNPDFRANGEKVTQTYLPERLQGNRFWCNGLFLSKDNCL